MSMMDNGAGPPQQQPQRPPQAQQKPPQQGQPQQPDPGPTESQMLQMQQVQLFQQALKLIKDSRLRTFRIDIENESTVELDIEQEKQSATELLKGIGDFCTGVLPVGQKLPQMMPLFGQMLLWGVRKFRSGRELEAELEQTVDKLEGLAKAAASNPPPDPEMAKVQQAAQESQQKLQLAQQTAQHEQAQDQSRMQFEIKQHQDDLELQREKAQQETALAQLKFQHETKLKEMELGHKMAMDQQELHHNVAMQHVQHATDTQLQHKQIEQQGELEQQKIASNEKIAKSKPAPKK